MLYIENLKSILHYYFCFFTSNISNIWKTLRDMWKEIIKMIEIFF